MIKPSGTDCLPQSFCMEVRLSAPESGHQFRERNIMRKEDLKITTFKDRKGYVFISYSSEDEDTVFNDFIIPLQEQYGLRIFCDQDFKNRATQTWTSQMRDNISDATACLLFISKSYVASYACMLEVLISQYEGKPVLKIQLNEPEKADDYTPCNISTSTLDELLTVSEQLRNKGLSYASNCCLDIKSQLNEGKISKFQVSKAFGKYLPTISCTILNRKSGLESIRNSLENIQGNAPDQCVFEKRPFGEMSPQAEKDNFSGKGIPRVENSSSSGEEKPEAQKIRTQKTKKPVSTPTGSTDSKNSFRFAYWERFREYLGDSPLVPGNEWVLAKKPQFIGNCISINGCPKEFNMELALSTKSRMIRCAILVPKNHLDFFDTARSHEDEMNEKARLIGSTELVEFDKKPAEPRIKIHKQMSETDENEDFKFLKDAVNLIYEVLYHPADVH